jgi:hypothetical protein
MIFHEVQITEAIVVLGVVWVTAIALLATNRPYIRFLEGYGEYNPLHWLLDKRAKRQFEKNAAPALEAQKDVDAARKTGAAEPRLPHHPKELRHAVERYPDQRECCIWKSIQSDRGLFACGLRHRGGGGLGTLGAVDAKKFQRQFG